MVMQRLHAHDLSGFLFENDPDFKSIVLPLIAEKMKMANKNRIAKTITTYERKKENCCIRNAKAKSCKQLSQFDESFCIFCAISAESNAYRQRNDQTGVDEVLSSTAVKIR